MYIHKAQCHILISSYGLTMHKHPAGCLYNIMVEILRQGTHVTMSRSHKKLLSGPPRKFNDLKACDYHTNMLPLGTT